MNKTVINETTNNKNMSNKTNNDAEFCANYTPNDYDQMLFSLDPVIFTIKEGVLNVLLVQRQSDPCKNQWALPGGRVDKLKSDDLIQALQQKLMSKTGLDHCYFEQVLTDGGLKMDGRGWSVSTVYMALVRYSDVVLEENQTGEPVQWHPVDQLTALEPLAFWHQTFIDAALARLRDKITYTDLPINMVDKVFTVRQLRMAYESILGVEITRQAFSKRANQLTKNGVIIETGNMSDDVGRPAMLYKAVKHEKPHVFSYSMTKVN